MSAKLPLRWTAQSASLGRSGGYRHFQLLGEQGKGAERAARLEAVLNRGHRLLVPLRELRDRSLWQPGWQSLRRPAAMQIIPAIDLLDGHCVRLHQGDYDQVTRFSDDPVAQALAWQAQGAERLHLVDLDGARSGQPINDQAVKAITA
ncbi:MAG: 1-(5-phosphoribosyl)-5-[(5-phosphoribosylamino)methylideneamino]imidazole-4-carboxamide isomerase, partial [Cyanobacteriota bacterium]